MTRMAPLRSACPGTLLLIGLSVLFPKPVAAEELTFQASSDYCAEIDGRQATDAGFFVSDPAGRLLVDLPSLSTKVLLALQRKDVVTVPSSSIRREEERPSAGNEAGADKDESKARLVVQLPSETPVSPLSVDGPAWSFQVREAKVRILKASQCRPAVPPPSPVVPPPPTGEPLTDDPRAKKCLHQDSRADAGTAGCTKSALLRNSCDVPVLALVQITQHLFSGTFPQTSSIVIPPGSSYPLGCVWLSGAMGPTNFDVLAAAFAAKPPGAPERDPPKH